MGRDSEVIEGGCHCGGVRFTVKGPIDQLIVCNCSMCSKKGFVHWIVDADRFQLLTDVAQLSTYTFGTKTARHHFCKTCGICSYYVPRSHPDGFSVNARCLDDVNLDDVPVSGFDGRHWEQKIHELR